MSSKRKGNSGWKRRYPGKVVEALASGAVKFADRDPDAPLPMPEDLYPKGWLEAAAASDEPAEDQGAEA